MLFPLLHIAKPIFPKADSLSRSHSLGLATWIKWEFWAGRPARESAKSCGESACQAATSCRSMEQGFGFLTICERS